nr:agouti-related protein isoform X1 [Odocoileus virginianus texanus]
MGLGGAWTPSGHKLFCLVLVSFPFPNPRPGRQVSCAWGVSALTLPVSGISLQPLLKRTTEEQDEEALLQEAEAKALAEVLDPEGRKPRSPRRCVRLHESCLGHQVPCCDPCATCYCRFFNAFCYCRKLGTTTNPCSRT